jgi:hypothetical protein
MTTIIICLAGFIITWLALMGSMLLAQRLADITFPPLGDFLLQTAAVVAIAGLVGVGLGLVNEWLGLIAGSAVYIGLMMKLFDLAFYQLFIIGLVTSLIGRMVVALLWTVV